MQAFTAQKLPARSVASGLNNRGALIERRATRTVVTRAAQAGARDAREEKGVSKIAVSAAAAFVAASLSLAGAGSVAAMDFAPRNAAPDLSLGKDDEALGNAFQKAGVPGDAKKAGSALQSKAKDIGSDPQGQAKQAASKAQNAAPDLSLGKDDQALGNAFQKAGVPGDAKKAGGSLKSQAKDIASDPAGKAKDAASKAQNAAPDLSLAKDDQALGNAFQKAGAPGNAKKAAESLKAKTPGVGSNPLDQAKDAANKVLKK